MPRYPRYSTVKRTTRRRVFRKSKYAKANKLVARGIVGATRPTKLFSYTPQVTIANAMCPLTSLNPYPKRKHAILRYMEAPYIGMACDVGGTGGSEKIFLLNSLYSPLVGGGHQPYWYDQMVADGYNQYRVNAVEVKITAWNPGSTGVALGWEFRSWPAGSGSLAGQSLQYIGEREGCGYILPGSTTGIREHVTGLLPINQIEGITRSQYIADVTNYSAQISASPSRGPYLSIACFDSAGNTGSLINAIVEIVFYAEFWDLQKSPHS